eukprot:TRINITY_DN3080_c0_g1_i1.p1 TRINITY_DN3080_c0_g1~~TRINITY_DN3080_c0_g1_i1.p1  ORF type:complete len:349 (+),score=91.27 TRINITY_DN3080_c0_g1_i1:341-1387(+)
MPSPISAAAWGWHCVGTNSLQCVFCQHFEVVTSHIDENDLNRLIRTKHELGCCWRISQCPRDFQVLSTLTIREFIKINLRSFQTRKFVTALRLDDDLTLLQDIISMTDLQDSSPFWKSVLEAEELGLLAVCGWRIKDDTTGVLNCLYCNRQVAPWNFDQHGDEASPTSSASIIWNAVSSTTTGSPSPKRVRIHEPKWVEETPEAEDLFLPGRAVRSVWPLSTSLRMEIVEPDEPDQAKPIRVLSNKTVSFEEMRMFAGKMVKLESEKPLFRPFLEHRSFCHWRARDLQSVLDQLGLLLADMEEESQQEAMYDEGEEEFKSAKDLANETISAVRSLLWSNPRLKRKLFE